jgi:hypothetical protein
VRKLPDDRIEPVPTSALGLRAPRPHRAGLDVSRARALLDEALFFPPRIALEVLSRSEPEVV